MFFFAVENGAEQLTAGEVLHLLAVDNGFFQIGVGNVLEPEIALQHFLDILADEQFVKVLQVGQAFEEQNPFDQHVGMLHLVDGFFVFLGRQLGDAPVFVHAGVQEVLVDGGQLVGKHLVEKLDDLLIAFHSGTPW